MSLSDLMYPFKKEEQPFKAAYFDFSWNHMVYLLIIVVLEYLQLGTVTYRNGIEIFCCAVYPLDTCPADATHTMFQYIASGDLLCTLLMMTTETFIVYVRIGRFISFLVSFIAFLKFFMFAALLQFFLRTELVWLATSNFQTVAFFESLVAFILVIVLFFSSFSSFSKLLTAPCTGEPVLYDDNDEDIEAGMEPDF